VERLTKIEYGCLIALSASARSEDPTTKVGCAVEDNSGKIISTGYNGLKSGYSTLDTPITTREDKLKYFIHAETNALSEIVKNQIKTIYITHSPCQYCAQNIVAHGIKEVIYLEEYKYCSIFKEIFNTFGVFCREVTETERNNIKKHINQLSLQVNKE